ncbi:hypothetical protein ACSBR1_016506 [Camellia fascicularis]
MHFGSGLLRSAPPPPPSPPLHHRLLHSLICRCWLAAAFTTSSSPPLPRRSSPSSDLLTPLPDLFGCGIVLTAKEMLRNAPELLRKKNKRGETALFQAAQYGKMEMFKFLDDEVNRVCENERIEKTERCREFYQRDDSITILHISILTEHFDLAFYIAKTHKDLVSAKDGDEMTALQLLACNPSAFNDGRKRRCPKRFINYSCVSTEDTPMAKEEDIFVVTEQVKSCCRIPLWETIQGKNQRYESTVRLAKYLIAKDTSWEAPAFSMDDGKPRTHKYGSPRTSSIPSDGQQVVGEEEKSITSSQVTIGGKTAETPLFLATKSGILEIVEEILCMYPEAVERIDHEGRNILHVAIKYRQIHIFDFVEKLEIPMMRLLRKINNDGNSILHMVGTKTEDAEDILLYDWLNVQRVKKISTAHFIEHLNNDGLTVEKLFAKNNAKLRTEAKEWLKRTAENCSIVAVLIATVAFAEAYTVPGGPNQDTGYPLLQTKPNQTILCDFHLDRCYLPYICFDSRHHIFVNPHIIISVKRLQAVSSPKTYAGTFIIDPFCVNDDACICNNSDPIASR